MRQIINFNAKWAFTKNADTVPTTLPEKWDFCFFLLTGMQETLSIIIYKYTL